MPYVSKTRGINLIKVAAEVILGGKIDPRLALLPLGKYACVKVPLFSFMRLDGSDPVLGVEMMSTGEVACIGENTSDALIKSMLAAEYNLPFNGNILFSVAGKELQEKISPLALRMQELGYKILATQHTADTFQDNGVNVLRLHKISERTLEPNLMNCVLKRKLAMVINIPIPKKNQDNAHIFDDEHMIRRKCIEFNIPVLTNIQLAEALIDAIADLKEHHITTMKEYCLKSNILSLNEYHEQLKEIYW